jgi:hypothetical protein
VYVVLASCVFALSLLALARAPVASASADGADAGRDASISRIPPDPTPMRERVQWIFDLRWDKGDVYLLGVHRIELPGAQETPRAMGRFAIELFEGPTLIERVRFDFPLLGDEPRDGGIRKVPWFGGKLVTRIGVMFPATSRGTKLELVDRASEKRWDLPWPPTDTRLLPHDAGDDLADAAPTPFAPARPPLPRGRR